MSKTVVVYNAEEHIVDLLKELVEKFVTESRANPNGGSLNNVPIGETKLVELEEFIDDLYTNHVDDFDESDTHQLIEELDKEHISSWVSEKIEE